MEIIKQAAKEGAMLVYTLADPSMAESAKKACNIWGIPATDVLARSDNGSNCFSSWCFAFRSSSWSSR